jgi:hypothetical protein
MPMREVAMSTRIQKEESEPRRKCRLTEQYRQIGIKAVSAAIKAKNASQSDKMSSRPQYVVRPKKIEE